MGKLQREDMGSWLATVWEALEDWSDAHEGRSAAGGETYEQRWGDICTAMAWIEEQIDG